MAGEESDKKSWEEIEFPKVENLLPSLKYLLSLRIITGLLSKIQSLQVSVSIELDRINYIFKCL